jgi:cytochrome d ubiquinol oxidase subunit I
MSDLTAARTQMAVSLGFHIVFAVAGMAMPLLMVIAEALWLRTRKPAYLELAKRWAKGTSILFAVGAVSGTVLSFELGLLWPKFMAHAGAVIGMPFSLEGFAFFLEAIFLGIYLYGWERVPPRAHWLAGAAVLASGTLSGLFVVTANAWMNAPAGFVLADGRFTQIRPLAAMLNEASGPQCLHMILAAFLSVGAIVAAIHAAILLRKPNDAFHRAAYGIALAVMIPAALLQPLAGDWAARGVARRQPLKLAALEGQWETERGAPLRIGGLPDEASETTPWALEIPKALSFLAKRDPDAEVIGLKSAPKADRPPVRIVHVAFQLMVFCGTALALTALLGLALWWKGRAPPARRPYLLLVALCGPLGIVALEAGWTVTEVGRQPWIIYKIMRTSEALTSMPGIVVPLTATVLVYLMLGFMAGWLLWRMVFKTAEPGRVHGA